MKKNGLPLYVVCLGWRNLLLLLTILMMSVLYPGAHYRDIVLFPLSIAQLLKIFISKYSFTIFKLVQFNLLLLIIRYLITHTWLWGSSWVKQSRGGYLLLLIGWVSLSVRRTINFRFIFYYSLSLLNIEGCLDLDLLRLILGSLSNKLGQFKCRLFGLRVSFWECFHNL